MRIIGWSINGGRKVRQYMKIKDIPENERPYEKLELRGAENLSNSELLAIIIKTGTKKESSVVIAQRILRLIGNNSIRSLKEISINQLMEIEGIGKVKAIQIKAVCELAKRMGEPIKLQTVIKGPSDVANMVMEEMRYETKEEARVLLLNTKNKVQKIIKVAQGGTNFAVIEPKEILEEAIKMGLPKIILLHNHPSGDPTPSKADYELTDKVYECAEMLGISLLDHIVIGDGRYESIFQNRDYRRNK